MTRLQNVSELNTVNIIKILLIFLSTCVLHVTDKLLLFFLTKMLDLKLILF